MNDLKPCPLLKGDQEPCEHCPARRYPALWEPYREYGCARLCAACEAAAREGRAAVCHCILSSPKITCSTATAPVTT